MTGRRREIRYDTPISGRIPAALNARLDAIADRNEITLGAVLRQVIEAGLPVVETETSDAGIDAEDVRFWWDGLSARERSKWGKRLRHIDGNAFKTEAYRLAMEEEG